MILRRSEALVIGKGAERPRSGIFRLLGVLVVLQVVLAIALDSAAAEPFADPEVGRRVYVQGAVRRVVLQDAQGPIAARR